MKCIHCEQEAKEGAKACVACIQKSRDECVVAIERSMEAMMKCHRNAFASGEMTERRYESDMKQYHNMRIERDVLLGLLPEPKKKARKIRW